MVLFVALEFFRKVTDKVIAEKTLSANAETEEDEGNRKRFPKRRELFESGNVGSHVIYRRFIRKCHGHRTHLLTISIIWITPTNSLFKVLELSHDIPVLLSGNFWCIQSFVAFAICAVTGRTDSISGFSCGSITLYCCRVLRYAATSATACSLASVIAIGRICCP